MKPTTNLLQQRGDLSVLRISNRHADATIALQGAQLLEYTPRGEQPVIWLSKQAAYQRGQGVRGGVPVCWPWFGALDRNPESVRAMTRGDNLPAHGLVRTRDWTLRSVREADDCTEVSLALSTDLSLQHWPHHAELLLTVSIGQSLKFALTTRNLGHEPIALAQALHTYFAISAIDTVAVSGFEGCRHIDTLDDWRELQQQGAIRFSGETDRIYLDVPSEVQLHDSGWQRTIRLRTSGSGSAVVWNPWVEKAKRLSQFAPEAWREMLCIETANVLSDSVHLAPAAEHTLALEITCDRH
jgi:glucose-6-phosphate 1-epimerase